MLPMLPSPLAGILRASAAVRNKVPRTSNIDSNGPISRPCRPAGPALQPGARSARANEIVLTG
jgi:hypothetical protein